MIKIPDNFDGEKFASKYTADFYVNANGHLICAAYPDLTLADIADCVVGATQPPTLEERLEALELVADMLMDGGV